jgi:hypothetical protein
MHNDGKYDRLIVGPKGAAILDKRTEAPTRLADDVLIAPGSEIAQQPSA